MYNKGNRIFFFNFYSIVLVSATQQSKSAIISIYSLPPQPSSPPPTQSPYVTTEHHARLPVLHSNFPGAYPSSTGLWIYADATFFMCPTPSLPHCSQVHYLPVSHSFPANRFTNTILLDSVSKSVCPSMSQTPNCIF